MSNKKGKLYKRRVQCPECGKVCMLWSKAGKKRKEGHIKTMTCFFCGKDVDMVELRPEN